MPQTRHADKTPRTSAESSSPAPSPRVAGARLREAVDRLMDDIDDVLEENAETFVKSYVQRGGE
jgi:ubiquitin-like protein Pup